MKKDMQKKGFTLIELLIVIGILSILIAAVVVVLNPAALLKQARDSTRMSDMSNLEDAINLYITTANNPTIGAGPVDTALSTTGLPFTGTTTVSSSTKVDGTGWIPINFTDTSGGSPLSVLPMDPINNGTYFYAYKGDPTNLTFELDSRLESKKYRGKMITDGGNKNTCVTFVESTCFYEIGTAPGLSL